MDYIGEKCPVCGEVFKAEDDIVVCPECGAPHHRACYAIENKCAYSAEHSKGKKWEPKAEGKLGIKVCPVCHFNNIGNVSNCQRCGTELKDITPVQPEINSNNEEDEFDRIKESMFKSEDLADPIKFLGYDEEEDMGGVTMKEMADFVGTNNFYYLPRFKRMKDEGLKPSFNITSLLFPTLYFANRKMWFWAILAACLGILFNLPADILLYKADFPDDMSKFITENKQLLNTISDIFIGFDMAVRALACFFANWLYFRFSLRKIKKKRSEHRTYAEMKASGGIKPLNMLLITLIKAGIGFIALLSFSFCFDMIRTINDFSTI